MKSAKNKKVVFLGSSGVGKTSIIKRYIYNKYEPAASSTKVAAHLFKVVETANCTYKL